MNNQDDPTIRPATPRIAPAVPDELDEDTAARLGRAGVPGAPASNILATLIRHPELYRRWLPLGTTLFAGLLPARDREILILRTGWRCRSDYEWGQHVLIAATVGFTDADIASLIGSPEDSCDPLLVRAADELHEAAGLSDKTWMALSDRYDEQQLIEIPMLVGHYHMLAFTLNALGVAREEGVAALPS